MTKLRVWHNCQVGAVKNFYVEVESIEQAKDEAERARETLKKLLGL